MAKIALKPASQPPPSPTAQVDGLARELGKKRPFDSPHQEAALNIIRTAGLLSCQAVRFFKAHDLSESGYNVLRILRGHLPQGVPSQSIAQMLVSQVPDVTRLVDRLVKQGLARREGHPDDRRVVIVQITKAGLDLLARLDAPLLELHQRQLGHLSKAELKELSRLLAKARSPGSEPRP